MKFPIGLQPYTLRNEMEKDYFGTLDKIAEIGYTGVELGRSAKISTSDLVNRLDQLGLHPIAVHTSEKELSEELDAFIDFCQQLGTRYAVLSWSPCDSKETLLRTAALCNRAGEKLRTSNIQLCYHNHHHEFVQFDGQYGMDILLQETDPEFVQMEMDTYWVKRGGVDPAAYLRQLKGRCPLLHMKDMEPGDSQFFAEVGEGIIDFGEILQAAQEVGTEWLIVEQDECRRSPLESVAISYRNLSQMVEAL